MPSGSQKTLGGPSTGSHTDGQGCGTGRWRQAGHPLIAGAWRSVTCAPRDQEATLGSHEPEALRSRYQVKASRTQTPLRGDLWGGQDGEEPRKKGALHRLTMTDGHDLKRAITHSYTSSPPHYLPARRNLKSESPARDRMAEQRQEDGSWHVDGAHLPPRHSQFKDRGVRGRGRPGAPHTSPRGTRETGCTRPRIPPSSGSQDGRDLGLGEEPESPRQLTRHRS